MPKAGVISDYLHALAAALSFDRSLARCVCQEVEDHLCEALAADPARDRLEAERRAIANFGDPHLIAAQFAVVSLARQTRRVGAAVVVVLVAVFATMKARIAWYAATQWAMRDDLKAAGEIVGLIDRYSFWLAIILGVAGLAYISSRRIPPVFDPGYRRQLRRSFLLCGGATASLAVSVICDGVLTTLKLFGTELGAASLLPVFSMAIEIACAGVLVFQIRGITRRATSTAVLLKT